MWLRSVSVWQMHGFIAVYIGSTLTGFSSGWALHALRYFPAMYWDVDVLIQAANAWWLGYLVIGALTPLLLNGIGRRVTLQLSAVILIVAWTILSTVDTRTMFVTARILAGVGDGLCFATGIAYVGEISDKRIRGAVLVALSLASSLGLLVSYLANMFLLESPTICLIAVGLTIVFAVLTLGITESPYYLAHAGKDSSSLDAFKKLRKNLSDTEVSLEHMEIYNFVKESRGRIEATSITSELFVRSGNRMSFLLTLLATWLITFSGNSVVSMNPWFEDVTGLKIINPFLPSVLLQLLSVVATLVTVLLVDTIGRRRLHLWSGGLTGVGLCAMLILRQIDCECDSLLWCLYISIVFHRIAVSLAILCLPRVILGESFPVQVKPLVIGLNMIFHTSCIFLNEHLFWWFNVFDNFTITVGVYFLCTILGTVGLRVLLIETRGTSLAEAFHKRQ